MRCTSLERAIEIVSGRIYKGNITQAIYIDNQANKLDVLKMVRPSSAEPGVPIGCRRFYFDGFNCVALDQANANRKFKNWQAQLIRDKEENERWLKRKKAAELDALDLAA